MSGFFCYKLWLRWRYCQPFYSGWLAVRLSVCLFVSCKLMNAMAIWKKGKFLSYLIDFKQWQQKKIIASNVFCCCWNLIYLFTYAWFLNVSNGIQLWPSSWLMWSSFFLKRWWFVGGNIFWIFFFLNWTHVFPHALGDLINILCVVKKQQQQVYQTLSQWKYLDRFYFQLKNKGKFMDESSKKMEF